MLSLHPYCVNIVLIPHNSFLGSIQYQVLRMLHTRGRCIRLCNLANSSSSHWLDTLFSISLFNINIKQVILQLYLVLNLNIDRFFLYQTQYVLVHTRKNWLQIKNFLNFVFNPTYYYILKLLLEERRLEDPEWDAQARVKIPNSYDILHDFICKYFWSFFA